MARCNRLQHGKTSGVVPTPYNPRPQTCSRHGSSGHLALALHHIAGRCASSAHYVNTLSVFDKVDVAGHSSSYVLVSGWYGELWRDP